MIILDDILNLVFVETVAKIYNEKDLLTQKALATVYNGAIDTEKYNNCKVVNIHPQDDILEIFIQV